MRVHVEPDAATLARHAAAFVAEVLRARPDAVFAVPTGRTPLGLYRELVRMHHDEALDFSRTRIFSLDEYIGVNRNDDRSFDHYLREHFLSKVNVLPANVHLLSSAADGNECSRYETQIRAAGGISLLIAGVGTNGHIAFNEPGATLNSRTRIVDLAPSTMAGLGAVFGKSEMPTRAVTMGIGTILEARKILVLASGSSKQKALAGLLQGPVTAENPVSTLRLHGDVTVIADQEAVPA
jgi:glucosamine-6-phosphate deaminase